LAQQKYSAYHRELLAIYEAVKYFQHMLKARHFTVLTDHKSLTFAFHQKRDKCSPRQCNHLYFISQFTTDIRRISGKDNFVADALSRVESISAPVTHDALAAAQEDDQLRSLVVSTTALQLEKLHIPSTSGEMYCETSSGKPCPYVPAPLRRQIFNSLQSLSHPGIKASAKLVSQRFVWPAMQKDYSTWARACQPCQRSKVSRHTITPVGDFPLPPARFLHIHIDLVGSLPSLAGF
jgi:hypothetical protein